MWFTIFNILLLVVWFTMAILALARLRHRQMTEIARVLWAFLIVLLPLFGGLAFLITQPGEPGRRNVIETEGIS
jgi:hypothetical protein